MCFIDSPMVVLVTACGDPGRGAVFHLGYRGQPGQDAGRRVEILNREEDLLL